MAKLLSPWFCASLAIMMVALSISDTTAQSTFTCTSAGKYADSHNCSYYFICTANADSGFLQTRYMCPSTSLFSVSLSKCVTPESSDCETFRCNTVGRFKDENNCANYYTCSTKSFGGFYQSLYSCPNGTQFDAGTSKCSMVGLPDVPVFKCATEGRFSFPGDCSQFYLCSVRSSGELKHNLYKCPSGSLFNKVTRRCSIESLVVCS